MEKSVLLIGVSLSFILIVKHILNIRNISYERKREKDRTSYLPTRLEVLEKIYFIFPQTLEDGEAKGKYTEKLVSTSKGEYILSFIGKIKIVKPSMFSFEEGKVYPVKGVWLKGTLYLEKVFDIDILEKSKKIISLERKEKDRDYYLYLGVPSLIISLIAFIPLSIMSSQKYLMVTATMIFLIIIALISILLEYKFHKSKTSVCETSGIYKRYSDTFGEVGDIPVMFEHSNKIQNRAFVSIKGCPIHNFGAIQVKEINGREVSLPRVGKKRMVVLLLLGLFYAGLLFKGYTHIEYTDYKAYLETLDKRSNFNNYQDIVKTDFKRGQKVVFENQLVFKTDDGLYVSPYRYHLLDKKIELSPKENTVLDKLYLSNKKLQEHLLSPGENPEVGKKINTLKSNKILREALSNASLNRQESIYKVEEAIEIMSKEYLTDENTVLRTLRKDLEKQIPARVILETSSPYMPKLPILEVKVNQYNKTVFNIPSDKRKYYSIPDKNTIIKRLTGQEVSSISGYIQNIQKVNGITVLKLTEFPVFSNRKIKEYNNMGKLLVFYAAFTFYFLFLITVKLLLYKVRIYQYNKGGKNESI